MSRGDDKAKRFWRPRFTIRTLAVVVTLIGAYFGAWEVTKKYGVKTADCSSPAPFILRRDMDWDGKTAQPLRISHGQYLSVQGHTIKSFYMLWLFGMTIQLPFESDRA